MNKMRIRIDLSSGTRGSFASATIQIDPVVCGVESLPRTREITFEFEAQQQAMEIRKRRSQCVDHLASILADHLLSVIEQEDPHFGYTKKEWERLG